MGITEKVPHTYEFTGRDLADALDLDGVVTGITASEYTYEDKKSGKCKNAYKISVRTMERIPDDEDDEPKSKKSKR